MIYVLRRQVGGSQERFDVYVFPAEFDGIQDKIEAFLVAGSQLAYRSGSLLFKTDVVTWGPTEGVPHALPLWNHQTYFVPVKGHKTVAYRQPGIYSLSKAKGFYEPFVEASPIWDIMPPEIFPYLEQVYARKEYHGAEGVFFWAFGVEGQRRWPLLPTLHAKRLANLNASLVTETDRETL